MLFRHATKNSELKKSPSSDSRWTINKSELSLKMQNDLDRQLGIAINTNQLELITDLVKKGADTERREPFSTYTRLMDVIVNSTSGDNNVDEEKIICLLKNGANPNAGLGDSNLIVRGVPLDTDASSLVLLLCRNQSFSQNTKKIADLLLISKANINLATKNTNMTALHYAVTLNCPVWVTYLIQNGADLSAKNQVGLRPLDMAKTSKVFHLLYDAILYSASRKLDDLYPEFHTDLLSGRIEIVKEKLKKYPTLATYNKAGSMPPVLSAIHHSFSHKKAPEMLDLLKEYKADFNAQYFVESHFGLEVNSSLNPISWLLLNGGDSRLMKKLIDNGTDKNHPSVVKISQLIKDHREDPALNEDVSLDENSYYCSPTKLMKL